MDRDYDGNFQFSPVCLYLQIQRHSTKIPDSMGEQADVIRVVNVFEKSHVPLKSYVFQKNRMKDINDEDIRIKFVRIFATPEWNFCLPDTLPVHFAGSFLEVDEYQAIWLV